MGTIERKGSENIAKSGATTVDQPNFGQPPNFDVGMISLKIKGKVRQEIIGPKVGLPMVPVIS